MSLRVLATSRTLACGVGLSVLLVARPAHVAPRGRHRPRRTAPVTGVLADQPGSQCHPGHHELTYHGGDLVEQPAVFVIFWGPLWQTDPAHRAAAGALRALLQNLGTSPYACAWAEYELPGRPVGAGTYAGDEVVPTAPVVPPATALDDATIQERILTEEHALRAPAPGLNTIYVVVPQQGVVVRVGGETGCGGPSFAFCAYHDSFAAGVDRFRYAVVPYPCTQGGGTCFVDAGEDVVNALAASASHEISETTTDPDAPPVAAGGWFEDRTGEENADVCQATSCLADLTLGGTTYPLNSLWSNLGSDCVAAVPCSAPRACEDPAPGACVVPTHGAAACALEWIVHPNLGSRRGLPSPTVVCADGQPFCDFDGAKDGRCTFRLAACLNNQDPRVACIPTAISTADLSPRTVNSSDPADQANVAALLGALAGADAASTAAVSGGTIAYQPPASTPNACTPYVDIVVPVRVTGSRVGPGSRTFRIAAKTTSGTATNRLRLVCNPTFP